MLLGELIKNIKPAYKSIKFNSSIFTSASSNTLSEQAFIAGDEL